MQIECTVIEHNLRTYPDEDEDYIGGWINVDAVIDGKKYASGGYITVDESLNGQHSPCDNGLKPVLYEDSPDTGASDRLPSDTARKAVREFMAENWFKLVPDDWDLSAGTEVEHEGVTFKIQIGDQNKILVQLRDGIGTIHREGETANPKARAIIEWLRDEVYVMCDADGDNQHFGSRDEAEAAAREEVGEDHTWTANAGTRMIEFEQNAVKGTARTAGVYLDPISNLELILGE